MKIKSLIKHNLMRAAMTLALILACAAAWAETVETYYIDENGTRHDVTATVVTTNMESLGTDGETTWYVVNENVFLYDGSNNQTHLHGNVNLILADGCELKPACGSNGPNDGFRGSGNLTLYGQTAGTGTLSCGQEGFMNITGDFTVCSGMVSVSGNFYNAIRAANFTMRGGSVSITNNTNNDCGIRATGTVNIYDGSVEAEGTNGIEADIVNIYGGSVTARCNGRNAPESNYGYAIQCSSTFNFYGGNVMAQGDYNWHEGQTRYGIHANSINLSWTSTDDWIYNTKDVNSDNVICYYTGSGGMNIAPYKPFTDGTTTYTGTLTDEQVEALADKTLQPVVPAFANSGDGTPEHPYTIYNVTGWNVFCEALQDNNTYNHFSGKYVKLGADISITQSAGSAGHEFMGTFDGDGKTLTVDITETTTQGTAPFREINGATIQNLVVTGSVDGTTHAAGLVGFARGADATTVNTITNCKVATNVTVTPPSGNNYHCGGVVGHAFHCTLNMSNTVYCGNITSSGNNYVGGLQGWSDGNTINFSHCLFAGSYSGTASFHPVAVRNNNNATTADVSHVYYTVTPTLTNSSFIAANGTKTISRATAPATIGDPTQSLNFMNTTLYQYGICYNNLYYATIGLPSGGTDIYLIDNADDWLYFCEMLYDNDTWNRFIGQTVKLGADIEVSRMAGADTHDFCGTFDGQNNTLTFTATATDNYLAPFRNVSGTSETNHAVIQNLNVVTNITATDFRHAAGLIAAMFNHVDVANCNVTANITANKGGQTELYPAGLVSQVASGAQLTVSGCTVSDTISTDGKYAGGMVGIVQGSASITNSVSSVTINSSTSGDGTHGGFVASLVSGRQLTIEGCVFNGKIVTTNGLTTKCGGFLGHNNTEGGTGATITNCLYAPTTDPNTVSTGCATFGRNVSSDLINNCYYTTALGDAQGTQAYSITAGDYVTTLANAGTVSNNYTTSGLIFYNVGLKYGDVLYAAENDEVSLTLGCTAPSGYYCTGYTATAGTLNGTTLTMPYGNVTINATLEQVPPVNYVDQNGETQQCTDYIWLTGTETTLGAEGQETWCVVHSTLNYSQGIQLLGNTHIILCDGAEMTVTGAYTYDAITLDGAYTLTIYGQSQQSGKLTLTGSEYGKCIHSNNGSIVMNGGIVNATADTDGAIDCYSFTMNGGSFSATSNYLDSYYYQDGYAIQIVNKSSEDYGNFTFNGGNFSAFSAYANGIEGYYPTFTLSWTNTSDSFYVSSLGQVSINIAEGKDFIDEDGNTYSGSGITGIDGKTLRPFNGCYSPKNLTVTGITLSSAMLTWEAGNNETQWQVSWSTDGGSTWSDPVTVNNEPQYEITNLNPETTVQVQVKSIYSEGQSFPTSITFTTRSLCDAPENLTAAPIASSATLNWTGYQDSYNVRYCTVTFGDADTATEDFEHSGSMPEGWTKLDLGDGANTAELGISTDAAQNGTYGFRFSSFNGNSEGSFDQYLISPELNNLSALSFYYRASSTSSSGETFRVGYSTTSNDVSAFTWVSNGTTTSTEFSEFVEDANNIPANAKYFAINYTAVYQYRLYIDNITYTYTPLIVGTWNETNTSVTSPLTISGLTSETQYAWQVQGLDCDGNGGTTDWSEMGSFTTPPCEVPSELTATDITATTATLNWNGSQESYNVRYQPVVILNEGFESGTMPDGWTRTGTYWQITSGTGYEDYTGAATGNYNAGCYINSNNRFDILITPVMDLGNVASATLSFNFWNNKDGYGEYNILKVHYRVDEGEWHLLYTYENATEGWIPVTINLEGMAANYQIGFEYESHYSYGMGIDDVMVIGINTSEWTTVTNVSSPHDITGLTPETQYVWQVQGSNCDGEGSTTEWSEVGTFTTLSPCEVAPSGLTATSTATTATLNWNGFQESYSVRYLPFILYEGFESGTMPDGWTKTNEYWEVTSGTGYYDHTGAATGNYNAGCFIGNYVDSDILITPVMDLGNVASATLSFNFWNTNWYEDIDTLNVYYRVNGGEWQSLYTNNDETEGWIPVTINLEGMAAHYQIGFECKDHNSYGMGIDDVMVTGINTSEWTTVTNVSSPHNLTGLTPETQYLWQVQGLDCDGEGSTTEWSEMGIFTTPLHDPVAYIDANGQTQQCTDYTPLTGTETTLTAGWYVADGTLDYDHTITLSGDIHLILKDNAVMNVTSTEGYGFYYYSSSIPPSISIYAQSTGESKGQLHVDASVHGLYTCNDITINGGWVEATSNQSYGIFASSGNVIINGGIVEATGGVYGIFGGGNSVEIHGGEVTAIGPSYGINAQPGSVVISGGKVTATATNGTGIHARYSITISGGQVTANGRYDGIYTYDGIILGWTNASDFIYASSFYINNSNNYITLSKAFKNVDGNTYESGPVNASAINGKTLYPSEANLFTKPIVAHGTNESPSNWYLIASPVGGVAATDVVNLVATTTPENPTNFDLYRFNQAAELEWENWKQQNSDHYHFNLEPGIGYLYANAADVNLVFAGTPYSGNGEVTLQKTEGAELSGWNLVGNPFSVDAYIGRDFYVLNEARSEVMPEASTGAIPSMEGVFVLAEQDEETVTFSTEALNKGRASKPEQVVLNLSRDRGLVIDRAIVRMGEGRTLPKFQLNRNSTKLYIPQDGTDYAIACAESTGEMPVNFKAKENGEYTITVNPENVEMAYLHLVDNMTGTDIDLLSPSLTPLNAEHLRAERSNPDQPATYTFTAKTTDYESRFKLVFASNNEDGPSTGSGTFAFYSNGNWIIANEGEATLQVIDITGRILSSETVNGSVSKSIQAAPGVYVLRLINGDNVKVQKIVVR